MTQGGNISVTNAPNNFIFNFQDANLGSHNFSLAAAASVGAGGSVTENYNTGYGPDFGSGTGSMTVTGFDTVTTNVWAEGSSAFYTFYAGGVLLWNMGDGNPETWNLNTAVAGPANSHSITDGALSIGADDINAAPAAVVGVDTITLLGGTLTGLPLHGLWSETGAITIGGTDYAGNGVVYGDVWIGVTNAFCDQRSEYRIVHERSCRHHPLWGRSRGRRLWWDLQRYQRYGGIRPHSGNLGVADGGY